EYFGSGIGLRLQRTDSDIAARVLAKSGREGEFLLALHDGFRSRRQYADWTREIMDECYEKVVGKSPAISTLKRKKDLQIWSPASPGGGVSVWLSGLCRTVRRLWLLLARSIQARWSAWSELPSFLRGRRWRVVRSVAVPRQ